ncbi:hypothetical protein [Aeromonas salmonicida]|uniref:hypothetical protein n=1 Tax=Aeromonas salmonicida TaxID=645 RepID=UPI003CE85FDD
MTSRHDSLRLYQPTNSTPDELTEQQLALFTLLQLREQEFGFNPNVIVHYPEAGFLGSPIGYLNQLISEQLQQGYFINQVVILTTYQILNSPLMQAGYQHEAVHMPAGPDHTAIFRWQCGTHPAGKTLYVEVVNEQDPKIRPTFVLVLRDEHGKPQGGMSGSIWTKEERRCATGATRGNRHTDGQYSTGVPEPAKGLRNQTGHPDRRALLYQVRIQGHSPHSACVTSPHDKGWYRASP